MVSIITSIALDAETADIKSRLIAHYGFSKWIRECLRRYAAEQGEQHHTHEEQYRVRGLCNGVARPLCTICWPEGAPSREHWLEWLGGELSVRPPPRTPYFQLPDAAPFSSAQLLKKPDRKSEKVGLLRRLLRFLI